MGKKDVAVKITISVGSLEKLQEMSARVLDKLLAASVERNSRQIQRWPVPLESVRGTNVQELVSSYEKDLRGLDIAKEFRLAPRGYQFEVEAVTRDGRDVSAKIFWEDILSIEERLRKRERYLERVARRKGRPKKGGRHGERRGV